MHKRNLSVDQNVKEMPMAYGFPWISYALSLQDEAENKTEIDEEQEAVCDEDVEWGTNKHNHQWSHEVHVEEARAMGTTTQPFLTKHAVEIQHCQAINAYRHNQRWAHSDNGVHGRPSDVHHTVALANWT